MVGFITTWLVVVAGGIGGLSRPSIGVASYYWMSILRPELLWFWAFGAGGNQFSKLVAIGTLVGWLAADGIGNLSRLGIASLPLKGLALFLLSGAVSTFLWAKNPVTAQENLVIQGKIALMAVVAVTSCRSVRDVWLILCFVLFGLTFLAWELNLAWARYYMIPSNILLMQGDNNNLSLLMVITVPVGIAVALASQRAWLRGSGVLASLMALHAVLFLQSRGAYLATIVVLSVYFLRAQSLPHLRRAAWLGLLAATCFVGVFAGERVVDEWNSIFVDSEELDESAKSRMDFAKAGVHLMVENPLGLGPRQQLYEMRRLGLSRHLLHNLYLQIGVDYGVIGLVGYLVYFFGAVRAAFRVAAIPIQNESDLTLTTIAFGLGVGLVGFLVGGVFLSCERIEIGVIAASLALGVGRLSDSLREDEDDERANDAVVLA